jgi:hypothetical protein
MTAAAIAAAAAEQCVAQVEVSIQYAWTIMDLYQTRCAGGQHCYGLCGILAMEAAEPTKQSAVI